MPAAATLSTPRMSSTMPLKEIAPLGGSFRAATGVVVAAEAVAADATGVAAAELGEAAAAAVRFEDDGDDARLLLGDAPFGVEASGALREGERAARADGGMTKELTIILPGPSVSTPSRCPGQR